MAVKKKLILDTSVIVAGKVSEMINEGLISKVTIIIPVAVLDELQAQASKNKEIGFLGLEELKNVRKLCKKKKINIEFSGERPSLEDIQLARSGRIDAIIRDVARIQSGTLLTSDYVQSLVAEAEGVSTKHIRINPKTENLRIEQYFNKDTLSIHLKEGVPPMSKRGLPGNFELVEESNKPLSRNELETIIKEITESARIHDHGNVEINRRGATIIQLDSYRVAITRPPFSDGLELTVVRPIIKLSLEDYKISERLMNRLNEQAEGILIAGSPGSGKSTLAASMAEFYSKKKKVVKTFESPKDLQVGPEITQYGPLEGDFEKTADILLLVRPDYTIFDEVRRPNDFQVFTDMRLAGVGMVGVVHASDPINSVQRFVGKVDLGIIPHIVDTVIFVRDGKIESVFELRLSVKVPSGMTEADLSRPVIEVKDFETGKLEYEIYAFGQENVVIPVSDVENNVDGIHKLASDRIKQVVRKFDNEAQVEVISNNKAIVRVDKKIIPRLIGRSGITISDIEDNLGIHIDVEPRVISASEEIKFKLLETHNSLDFILSHDFIGRSVNVYIDTELLLSSLVGKKARIKISKSSDSGRRLVKANSIGKIISIQS